MRPRHVVSLTVLGVAGAVVLWLVVPVLGQAPSSTWTARTAWGEPDLQGVWDYRSLTPLERPSELGGKEVLTDDEAADFEQAVTRPADDIDPKTGKLATSADGVVPYNNFWMDWGTSVVGSKRTSLIVDPPDGRIPPFTPEFAKKRAAEAEARRGVGRHVPTPGGWVDDLGTTGLRVRCVVGYTSGPPNTPGAYNNNIQLFQAPGHVAILSEQIHGVRIVPLDGRAHGDVRQWMGDSRGRWEGQTLVVDTINFFVDEKSTDTIGSTVFGYGPRTHLIERFTRVDADTLVYEFTVDDPDRLTRPWTAQLPMRKNPDKIYEYACHEGNYGLYNILAGARAKERADVATKK